MQSITLDDKTAELCDTSDQRTVRTDDETPPHTITSAPVGRGQISARLRSLDEDASRSTSTPDAGTLPGF